MRVSHTVASASQDRDRDNISKLRKIAQTRWSNKLQRIAASNIKMILGREEWDRFVRYAKKKHYNQYIARFTSSTLVCAGSDDGIPCPHSFQVDTSQNLAQLQYLHLDHDTDLKHTCEDWRRCLCAIDKTKQSSKMKSREKLAALLFLDLTFRCCKPGLPAFARCHRTDLPKYSVAKLN